MSSATVCHFGALFCRVSPNVFTYTATISACSKGSAAEAATGLRLFHEMKRDGITPTQASFNAAIAACNQDWRQAIDLIDEMGKFALSPNCVSFSAAINVCAKAKKGDLALEIFRRRVV